MKQAVFVLLAILIGIGVAFLVVRSAGLGISPEERAVRGLTSESPDARSVAIATWVEPTGRAQLPGLFSDWTLMEALRPALATASPEAIRDIGDAFAQHPQWAEQFPEAHERYLLLLASAPAQADAANALRHIQRLEDLATVSATLEVLAAHPDAAIRLSALEHASHRLGRTAEPLVVELLDDEDRTVSRTAWLTIAVFKPSTGLTAKWGDASVPVRNAMLYAIARVDSNAIAELLNRISSDRYFGDSFGDIPFLLKYIADGHPPDDFVADEILSGQLHKLVDDARRARQLYSGTREDLLHHPR